MPDTTLLTQFPRPSVAVDTAVLCPVPGRGLHVLLTLSDDGHWQLPGSILRPQERLAEAVARCLREKAGLVDRAPVQLHVFDQPDRDDRGWVISVAHLDVLAVSDLDPSESDPATAGKRKMVPVHDVHELSDEHQEIVRVAVHRLRAFHERTPDPFGLLDSEFSLRQLRSLHEVVAGAQLQADTFRRTMLPMLEPTGRALSLGRGRPAQTFTRRSEIALHRETLSAVRPDPAASAGAFDGD